MYKLNEPPLNPRVTIQSQNINSRALPLSSQSSCFNFLRSDRRLPNRTLKNQKHFQPLPKKVLKKKKLKLPENLNFKLNDGVIQI